MPTLMSSYAWARALAINCRMISPDGWNRKDLLASYQEKIPQAEFYRRLERSLLHHIRDERSRAFCSCLSSRGLKTVRDATLPWNLRNLPPLRTHLSEQENPGIGGTPT